MPGIGIGFGPLVAFVAGAGFVLSSTAIVMQLLTERGEAATAAGQRIVSILLLEDLAIVPLLALIAFLAPGGEDMGLSDRAVGIAIALASIALLVAAGRWLLNPMFRILAQAHAREVMTAAALLVVLGAALAMQIGGLSMALGAFLAGVLLSESTFRHQLEADIEPFRGILLGLFFMSVGMSLDLSVLGREWTLILVSVVVYMALKAAGIYVVARLLGAANREALTRAALLAQGGEFAFVLFAAAASVGILEPGTSAVLTATVIISMALTPLGVMLLRRLLPDEALSTEGVEEADGLTGRVLIIGFGRFGQIVSQPLLARGVDVSIIDDDVEMIQAAANFGFKVYYGDGTRLDILRAAGAEQAEAVLVCVDRPEAALAITEHVKAEFPFVKVLARSFDRAASIRLLAAGVDYQLRETLHSALEFGEQTLLRLGVAEEEAAEIMREVRKRDAARLEMQVAGGIYAGNSLVRGNAPVPEPLSQPRKKGRGLNEETAGMIKPAPAD